MGAAGIIWTLKGRVKNLSILTIRQASFRSGEYSIGDTSDIVMVKTDATQYDEFGDTALIDGGGVTVNSLELVPAPMSLGVLAAGGVICAARRSRRRI